MQPKLSVVTVCLDNPQGLERTILSVIAQDYAPVEYIVIDGGSGPATMAVMQRYASSLAFWCSEPDQGIYDAMNKGIAHSTGEWLLFLNAGDTLYAPDVLTRLWAEAVVTDETLVVYGNHAVRTANSDCIVTAGRPSRLKRNMPFSHQAALIRNFGFQYETQFRIAADYALFRHLYATHGAGAFAPCRTTVALCERGGISDTQTHAQRNEYLTIYRRYPRGLYYWCYWLLTKLHLDIRFGYERRLSRARTLINYN